MQCWSEPGIAGLSCEDVRYRGPNLSTLWFCGETIIKCVWLLAFMLSLVTLQLTCILKKNGRSWSRHSGILWFTEEELRDAPDAEAGAEAGTPEPPAGHSWHAHGGYSIRIVEFCRIQVVCLCSSTFVSVHSVCRSCLIPTAVYLSTKLFLPDSHCIFFWWLNI